jgi:hypothetical protein
MAGHGLSTYGREALGLAVLTPLGFVLELLVVKKKLLARGKNKIPTAVDALQSLVLEFHVAPVLAYSQYVFGPITTPYDCARPGANKNGLHSMFESQPISTSILLFTDK